MLVKHYAHMQLIFGNDQGVHLSGPSPAFEKWSGHEISKTFYECRRHELGESTRGGNPPLVSGVRGISPEKILYFRTSVQTILMHFGTILALEALLIL